MKKYIILCIVVLKTPCYAHLDDDDIFQQESRQTNKNTIIWSGVLFYKPFSVYKKYYKISHHWATDFKNNLGYGGYGTHIYRNYREQWSWKRLFYINAITVGSVIFPIINTFPIIGVIISFIQIYFGLHYFLELINIQIPRYDFLLCEHPLFQVYYRFDYDVGYKYIATTNQKLTTSDGILQGSTWGNTQAIKKNKVFHFSPGLHLFCMFSYDKNEKIKPFCRILPIGYNLALLVNGEHNIIQKLHVAVITLWSSQDDNNTDSSNIVWLSQISFLGIECGGIIFKKIELCFFFKPSAIINAKEKQVYDGRKIIFSLGFDIKLIAI